MPNKRKPRKPETTVIAKQACEKIVQIIMRVENRCMAVDGPVTPTTKEISEEELQLIWKLALRGMNS